MSKQLDRIMQISGKGYVDDFADNIVRKLDNIGHENNDNAYTDILRISDLLCIMRYLNVSFSAPDHILLSYMKNLRNNISGLKILPWAELFLAISIYSLAEFFTAKTGSLEYTELYWRICISTKKYAVFEMTEETTLQMLLDGICGEMFASWSPGFNNDEYIDKIENCCLIVKQIFVDGIAAWYYNRFDIFELSKSIKGNAIKFDESNDDCDDDDEIPF